MADPISLSFPRIFPLSREIVKKNIETFMEIEKDYPDHWTEENFLYELPEKWNLSRYAVLGNDISGFIIASRKNDHAHLHRFMVSGECRGNGVGKILYSNFEKACRTCKGITNITLNVLRNNSQAIKLYERLGYIELDSDFKTHKKFAKLL